MSINIPAETPDESMNPISVEEFERLHPAMLGAIREVVREELAAREESPVFDHPQDMLLGGSEDWHPRFKVTPAFGDGRFLLTIQLGASYGLSFHCDARDLYELAEAAVQALKTARPEGDEPSMTRPSEDAYEPHPTTSIPRDSHTSPRRGR
jgi:hypothetical protein